MSTSRLPRSQAGSSTQHLLTTLLGDYWSLRTEHIPSAALVAMLGEFDIRPAAARAGINRLARRGLLVSSRSGRNSLYGLAPGAADLLLAGAYRFVAFGGDEEEWDGRWTLVLFTLSEQQRDLRYSLHARLRWLGFAPLYDGTWVSPRPAAEQVRKEVDGLGVPNVSIFRGVEQPDAARPPIEAWDLDEIERVYREFLDTYGPLASQVRRGQISTTEALLARTRIIDSWRSFPGIDPALPVNLLPPGWPRREAHDLFVEVYDALGPLAAIRVRQILARFDEDLAELIEHHSSEWLRELGRQAMLRRSTLLAEVPGLDGAPPVPAESDTAAAGTAP